MSRVSVFTMRRACCIIQETGGLQSASGGEAALTSVAMALALIFRQTGEQKAHGRSEGGTAPSQLALSPLLYSTLGYFPLLIVPHTRPDASSKRSSSLVGDRIRSCRRVRACLSRTFAPSSDSQTLKTIPTGSTLAHYCLAVLFSTY